MLRKRNARFMARPNREYEVINAKQIAIFDLEIKPLSPLRETSCDELARLPDLEAAE